MEHVSYRPLTTENWADLEALFGPRGASGGCWCMWWRIPRSTYDAQKGASNKAAFKQLVESGTVTGLLFYVTDRVAAWCAFQPRSAYPVLNRSRILKAVDDQPVWSLPCFFVHKTYRRQGLMDAMLHGVLDYARSQHVAIVEAYPIQPKKDRMPSAFAWTGFYAAFKRAGFAEVARRSETRPIMRYTLSD